jgi:hypothetical protein
MGVIVDCSGVFRDERTGLYARKLNLIDSTFHIGLFMPAEQSTYLTVYIYHQEGILPNPFKLGDLIYLKR